MPRPTFQDLARFTVPKGFRKKSSAFTQTWWIVQATLINTSPQFMYRWRAFILKAFGAKIGKGVKIRQSVRVTYPWNLEIGDHSWIGDRVELYTLEKITIGSNTCISQDTYVCTGSHNINSISFDYECTPIDIGDEVWIATGCFIAPGVTVGKGAVIGARSLVLTAIDSKSVWAGSPARKMRERKSNI